MARQIWKFQLQVGAQTIEMPRFARVLSVADQHGAVVLWALVGIDEPRELREFVVVGTGWDFNPDGLSFVGTVVQSGLVWHVWEPTRLAG